MNQFLSKKEMAKKINLFVYNALFENATRGIDCLESYKDRINCIYQKGDLSARECVKLRGNADRGIEALRDYQRLILNEKKMVEES